MADNTRHDRAIVFDLELTCWADDTPPPGERAEIIEIGLAECDLRAGRLVRSGAVLVRNQASRVSDYCTRLTTLTQADLDAHGQPLAKALKQITRAWATRSRPLYCWGDDGRLLAEAAAATGSRHDQFRAAHDLAAFFRTLAQARSDHPGSGSGVGVIEALDMLGLAFEGRPHRAEADARNTGRILIELTRRTWA